MTTQLREEIARNLAGYFLVLIGLVAIAFSARISNTIVQTAMVDSGKGLIGAALIAFQLKRNGGPVPDPLPPGSTATVNASVTTPAES